MSKSDIHEIFRNQLLKSLKDLPDGMEIDDLFHILHEISRENSIENSKFDMLSREALWMLLSENAIDLTPDQRIYIPQDEKEMVA